MNNKIRIKQIESGEFQDLIESLASGVVSRFNPTGSYRFNLSSGVDSFSLNYGATVSGYPCLSVGSSGVNDPIILGFVTGFNSTGVRGALSAPTVSSNYFCLISF